MFSFAFCLKIGILQKKADLSAGSQKVFTWVLSAPPEEAYFPFALSEDSVGPPLLPKATGCSWNILPCSTPVDIQTGRSTPGKITFLQSQGV